MIGSQETPAVSRRRLPVGAQAMDGGTHFRVWAPQRTQVEVLLDGQAYRLRRDAGGYFESFLPSVRPGSRYSYRLDGAGSFPDPASRYQPEGVHGPSEIVAAGAFGWMDSAWPGISAKGQVLYEMHVGTFTPEGTWQAAMAHLPDLAELGISVIEVMPVAECPGRFNWGYDGVSWF